MNVSRSMPMLALVLLLGGLLALPDRARAEGEEEIGALLDRLDDLRRAEDAAALAEALAPAADLYRGTENSGLRSKMRGMLGKILKDDDLGDARLAALEALVGLEDPKAAWKEIGRVMPSPKAEEATALDLAVVKAAGTLAPSAAVKDLLDLADKAKALAIAKEAILSLGHYGRDKRARVRILEELMSTALRTRPGQSTSKGVSDEARERWATLGPAFLEALNALTGRRVVAFEDWENLWRENKRRPQDLFVLPDEEEEEE